MNPVEPGPAEWSVKLVIDFGVSPTHAERLRCDVSGHCLRREGGSLNSPRYDILHGDTLAGRYCRPHARMRLLWDYASIDELICRSRRAGFFLKPSWEAEKRVLGELLLSITFEDEYDPRISWRPRVDNDD